MHKALQYASLLCMINDMMQKLSATVCTCKCMVPLILLYLVLRKWFLQVQYHCPLMYDVNQVIYVRMFSTGGKDLVTKHDANGHQQSMDQCTAAQTHVTLTGLCQSVNTTLANYNLTPCNLRLSKLLKKSITYCMYQSHTHCLCFNRSHILSLPLVLPHTNWLKFNGSILPPLRLCCV